MYIMVFCALNNILSVSFFNILAGAKTIVAGYGQFQELKKIALSFDGCGGGYQFCFNAVITCEQYCKSFRLFEVVSECD